MLRRRWYGDPMFAFDLGGPELIILLVVILVLFGGSQLPKLAKNLGQAQKEFKKGLDEPRLHAIAACTGAAVVLRPGRPGPAVRPRRCPDATRPGTGGWYRVVSLVGWRRRAACHRSPSRSVGEQGQATTLEDATPFAL
jgi:sec-independent protein translocase protein TatA